MVSTIRIQQTYYKVKDAVFAIMFLMSETTTNQKRSLGNQILTLLLLFVDFGQVLRTTFRQEFGWDSFSVSISKSVDPLNKVVVSLPIAATQAVSGCAIILVLAVVANTACEKIVTLHGLTPLQTLCGRFLAPGWRRSGPSSCSASSF